MHTLLHERSSALSTAVTDRSRDHAIEIPSVEIDPGLYPWKSGPNAPIESATPEESTQSSVPTAPGADGGEEPPASDAPQAPRLSKVEFILGLPQNLGVREVVARAKERGLTISEPYVYQVRYDALAAPRPASTATAVATRAEDGPTAADGQGSAAASQVSNVAPPNKSAFIRGLPMDMRPKEVVALAREQGIAIDRSYVKGVRTAARERALRARPATSARPASAPPARPVQSKSEFIRSLPSSISYAEAATKAKAVGILLSASLFYAVMSQVKRDAQAALKSEPVRTPIKQVTPAPAPGGLKLASDDAHEQALIDVVRALGLSRSRAVIDLMETVERVANAAR